MCKRVFARRLTWLATLVVAFGISAQAANFTLTSNLNSATPFTITLPATLPNGGTVKTVVIRFVTADCVDAPGVTSEGTAQLRTFFQGNFAYYTLTFSPALSFVNDTEFAFDHRTLMFADGGSVMTFGLSAGQPTCTVTLSGELLP